MIVTSTQTFKFAIALIENKGVCTDTIMRNVFEEYIGGCRTDCPFITKEKCTFESVLKRCEDYLETLLPEDWLDI